MSNIKTIYLATKNNNKIKEINQILLSQGEGVWGAREPSPPGQKNRSQNYESPYYPHFLFKTAAQLCPTIEWDETGTTYHENALIKAQEVRKYTDGHILAEDSGIEIRALGGAPGVYSQGYAPGKNQAEQILQEMQGKTDRFARYVCVLVFLEPNGQKHIFEGFCEGEISFEAKGEHGFAYDPIFIPKGYTQTFAELGDLIKTQISHRHHAFLAWEHFTRRGL